jgi:hypothetical protein
MSLGISLSDTEVVADVVVGLAGQYRSSLRTKGRERALPQIAADFIRPMLAGERAVPRVADAPSTERLRLMALRVAVASAAVSRGEKPFRAANPYGLLQPVADRCCSF